MTPESFVAVICTDVSFNHLSARAMTQSFDRMRSSAVQMFLGGFLHNPGGSDEVLR